MKNIKPFPKQVKNLIYKEILKEVLNDSPVTQSIYSYLEQYVRHYMGEDVRIRELVEIKFPEIKYYQTQGDLKLKIEVLKNLIDETL